MKEVSLSLHEVLHHGLLDGLERLYYTVYAGLWSQIGSRMIAVLEIEAVGAVENRTQGRLGVANSGWMAGVRMR
jgi:hypothetical protein